MDHEVKIKNKNIFNFVFHNSSFPVLKLFSLLSYNKRYISINYQHIYLIIYLRKSIDLGGLSVKSTVKPNQQQNSKVIFICGIIAPKF